MCSSCEPSDGLVQFEDPVTDIFDSIVYGERVAGQWIAGSDFFNRTAPDNGGAAETSTSEVMIAIVYDATNGITIYRNGVEYGARYVQGTLVEHPANGAGILLGKRHSEAGAGSYYQGSINEARVYNAALTPELIAEIAAAGPVD